MTELVGIEGLLASSDILDMDKGQCLPSRESLNGGLPKKLCTSQNSLAGRLLCLAFSLLSHFEEGTQVTLYNKEMLF